MAERSHRGSSAHWAWVLTATLAVSPPSAPGQPLGLAFLVCLSPAGHHSSLSSLSRMGPRSVMPLFQ